MQLGSPLFSSSEFGHSQPDLVEIEEYLDHSTWPAVPERPSLHRADSSTPFSDSKEVTSVPEFGGFTCQHEDQYDQVQSTQSALCAISHGLDPTSGPAQAGFQPAAHIIGAGSGRLARPTTPSVSEVSWRQHQSFKPGAVAELLEEAQNRGQLSSLPDPARHSVTLEPRVSSARKIRSGRTKLPDVAEPQFHGLAEVPCIGSHTCEDPDSGSICADQMAEPVRVATIRDKTHGHDRNSACPGQLVRPARSPLRQLAELQEETAAIADPSPMLRRSKSIASAEDGSHDSAHSLGSSNSSEDGSSLSSRASLRTFRQGMMVHELGQPLVKPLPRLPLPPTPPDTPQVKVRDVARNKSAQYVDRHLSLESPMRINGDSHSSLRRQDHENFQDADHGDYHPSKADLEETSVTRPLALWPPQLSERNEFFPIESSAASTAASLPTHSHSNSNTWSDEVNDSQNTILAQRRIKTNPNDYCPICLEPISFRLAGERPHVVPDCGHAMHDECFAEACTPNSQISLGHGVKTIICTLCRAPIRLTSPESRKQSRNDDIIPDRRREMDPAKDPARARSNRSGTTSSIRPRLRAVCDRAVFDRGEVTELQRLTALLTVQAEKVTRNAAQSRSRQHVTRQYPSMRDQSYLGIDSSEDSSDLDNALRKLKDKLSSSSIKQIGQMGHLRLHHPNMITIKDGIHKRFQVYVFDLAIYYVTGNDQNNVLRLLKMSASSLFDIRPASNSTWRIRGRVMMSHITAIERNSTASKFLLTCHLGEQEMDEFTFEFADLKTLEIWERSLHEIMKGIPAPKISGASGAQERSCEFSISDRNASNRRQQRVSSANTATDLVVVLSTSARNCTGTTWKAKVKLLEDAIGRIASLLRPGDRVAIVLTVDNVLVTETSHRLALVTSQKPGHEVLEPFFGALNSARSVDSGDRDRISPAIAINQAFDILLQRKQSNPQSNIIYISETRQVLHWSDQNLVLSRADAVKSIIHTFGFGKSHSPALLVKLANKCYGQYAYLQEWSQLPSSLEACMDHVLSENISNVQLHLQVPEDAGMILRRVAGAKDVLIGTNSLEAYVELGSIRLGSSIEILVDLEIQSRGRNAFKTDAPNDGKGTTRRISVNFEDLVVLETELSCCVHGSLNSSRVVLPLENLVVSEAYSGHPGSRQSNNSFDPSEHLSTIREQAQALETTIAGVDYDIHRRRLEILFCDMLAQSLSLLKRNEDDHAKRVLGASRRIIDATHKTLAEAIRVNKQENNKLEDDAWSVSYMSSCPESSSITDSHSRAVVTLSALSTELQHYLQVMSITTHKPICIRKMVEQAFVVRDQRSFSSNTGLQRLFIRRN